MTRKRMIIIGSAGGVTFIVLPTVIMSQWGSAEEAVWNHDIPELVVAKDIQQKYRDTGCLRDYFGSIDWANTTSIGKENIDFPDFTEASLQSCLTVAHQKQKYVGDKWSGRFKLVWSLTNEKDGLITTIKAKTEEGKLKLSSVAYIANNKEDKWIITKLKENSEEVVENNQIQSQSQDLFNKIPQPGNIDEHKNFMGFWGFNPDLKKICKKGDCEKINGARITSSTTWIFSKETTKQGSNITSWSGALNTWLEKTFGWSGLFEKLEKITGSWLLKSDLKYQ